MTKKKFSFVAVFFIAGIVLAVFISVSAVREAYRSKTIEKEVESLRQEAQRIQSENEAMTQRIAYFETAQFQEKIAKEKLNLQKPDENVVVVKPGVGEQVQLEKVQNEVLQDAEEQSNYLKWWDSFFRY
jgi:cell division protein FtsL